MAIRVCCSDDADAVAAIYAPVVTHTAISFETQAPSVAEMRRRIESTLLTLPWLVSVDEVGAVDGYAYGARHRERAAYGWSVDTTVYVRDDRRGLGVGRSLCRSLLGTLRRLGYRQSFVGIALPNDASVGLHEAVGFTPVGVFRGVGFKLGAWRDVGWWQLQIGADGPAGAAPRDFDGTI